MEELYKLLEEAEDNLEKYANSPREEFYRGKVLAYNKAISTMLNSARKENDTIDNALDIISQYGGTDGAHHKAWVIDQVVRTLTGEDYEEWVIEMKKGEDGPDTYDWDEGVAP